MKVCINHIAILLPSLINAVATLQKDEINVEAPQKFISEGTEESYAGTEKSLARLLLMAPIGTGPYKRALKKRGAGLHHIAIDVDDIEGFILKMSSTGWLLHPSSLQRYKEGLAIYFARPGVNTLIEVENRKVKHYDYFINKIYIPVERGKEKFINDLSLKYLIPTTDEVFRFQINNKIYTINMLL
jgi:hypothetical protein